MFFYCVCVLALFLGPRVCLLCFLVVVLTWTADREEKGGQAVEGWMGGRSVDVSEFVADGAGVEVGVLGVCMCVDGCVCVCVCEDICGLMGTEQRGCFFFLFILFSSSVRRGCGKIGLVG